MELIHLGVKKYIDVLKIMNLYHAEMMNDLTKTECIIVTEFTSVVTMGNRNLLEDLKVSSNLLADLGVDYVKIDRGGSVTVHELGQVVIYPLLRFDGVKRTVKKYIWCLEEAMIMLCQNYNIHAMRDKINPGVWVGQNKIGAVGVKISNRISKHGLAFNINNSLKTFDYIYPCGLKNRWVTNLQNEINNNQNIDFVKITNELVMILIQLLI